MEIVLILFLIGFALGTFYLHIEFWINTISLEHDVEITLITLFTLPFFPIFGTIELIRKLRQSN